MVDPSGRGLSGQVWEKTAFTIIATLIAAGVIGLWRMNDSVARLEERVSSWTIIYEKRFETLDRKLEELRTRRP